MSATNRGGERITADNYPTPKWVVDRLLEALPPELMFKSHVIEPFAGEGAIVKALAAATLGPAAISTIEVRESACHALQRIPGEIEWPAGMGYSVTHADALQEEWPMLAGPSGDRIITNPPFEHAERAIRKALDYGIPSCFLERVGFGQGPRAELFRVTKPSMLEIPERVSFAVSLKCTQRMCDWAYTVSHTEYEMCWKGVSCRDCGSKLRVTKTDATGYAWYCWNIWKEPRYRMLASTPKAERMQHG
jgi:predicted RNA methylase